MKSILPFVILLLPLTCYTQKSNLAIKKNMWKSTSNFFEIRSSDDNYFSFYPTKLRELDRINEKNKDGTYNKEYLYSLYNKYPIVYDNSFFFIEDFVIESHLSSDDSTTMYGVIWNFKDKLNYYYAEISYGRYLTVKKIVNGIQSALILRQTEIKKFKSVNKLKIEKKDKKTIFSINGEIIVSKKIKYDSEPGKIGVFGSVPFIKRQLKTMGYNVHFFSFSGQQEESKDNSLVVNSDIKNLEIKVNSPDLSRGFSIVKNSKSLEVQGKITSASKIYEVLVNNQEAYVDANGNFSKKVILGVGENSFTVKATDVKMNSASKTFTIKREAEEKESVVVNNNRNQNNSSTLKTGKYYALIIGNNEYKDQAIASLDEPIKDASELYDVLTSKYAFSPENVTLLKNATYVETITAFDKLGNELTANDNLLVFYAGHGWWDETKDLGYWLPTDAMKSNTAFWIRNSTISDYMASIKTKHTLLIADACFSGSIFKTRAAFDDASLAIKKLNDLTSKTAMTSGNLKEVPDQSVFLKYLVKRLNENTEKYLPADKLFSSFRIAVMNNSPNAPQFGTIQNAGDEGGEFIFVKKEN